MKLTRSVLVLLLSASVLSACNQGDKNVTVNGGSEIQAPVEKVIKKHEAVNLPVEIYMDSDYDKMSDKKEKFIRRITSVEVKGFDESSEIEFLDRYDDAVRRQNLDLQKDYKLLVITLAHEIQGEKSMYEAFMLNAGSGLVVGDDELAATNEFLSHQLRYIATDYRVGKSTDKTGNVFLAIPTEFVSDQNLQLKITQKLDNESKNIYIDLN